MIKSLCFLCCLTVSSHAILVTTGYSANELADYIIGSNVTITNSAQAHFTSQSAGKYEDAFVLAGTESSMFDGVVMSTGSALYLNSNYNTSKNKSLQLGLPPDQDFQNLLPINPYVQTYDACYLEFDFIPEINGILSFSYLFGSEEYFYDKDPLYERYTDVMGIFINGENIALLPGSNTPVGVKTVNEWYNSQYFNDNNFDYPMYATEMNGFTDPFVTTPYMVIAGENYHFKVGLTDANDLSYDSWLLLGKHTLRVDPVQVPEGSTTRLLIIGLILMFFVSKIEQNRNFRFI